MENYMRIEFGSSNLYGFYVESDEMDSITIGSWSLEGKEGEGNRVDCEICESVPIDLVGKMLDDISTVQACILEKGKA